jgi:hypothetical protein
MNLAFSVEKLYETGWQPKDVAGCERLEDGRLYPSVLQVQQSFAAAGFDLAIRHVQLFDCYRAVWMDSAGVAAGAVVGADEREAAVYALAQLRRTMPQMAAGS